jgi:DNA-directed RNA polymerase beta subunit
MLDWKKSGLAGVEDYFGKVLGAEELIKSKLENPLLVADRVIVSALSTLQERQATLEADERTIDMIDETMLVYNNDLERDLRYYKEHIQKLFTQLEKRIDDYLEESISIFNMHNLLDNKKFQEDFLKATATDLSTPIDEVLQEVSELLATRSRLQAKSALEYIGHRHQRLQGKMIGSVYETQFDNMRGDILNRFRDDVSEIIQKTDAVKEAKELSDTLRNSALGIGASLGVSASSLGMLMVAHTLDITGTSRRVEVMIV